MAKRSSFWNRKAKLTFLAIIGLLAVSFSVLSGLLNMWHWPTVDYNPITYNAYTPVVGLIGDVLLLVMFYLGGVKNKAIWIVTVFWVVYNLVLIWMVWFR